MKGKKLEEEVATTLKEHGYDVMVRVGHCTICGRDAGYNTPKLRHDNGELVCDNCGDACPPELEDIFLIGVNQYKSGDDFELDRHGCVQFNRMVVWRKDGRIESAWTHGGQRAFYIRDHERELDYLEFFSIMEWAVDDNHFRCSSCGRDWIGEPAGYPLFAGVSCEMCWKEHQDETERQRQEGKVCLKCRKPYNECYC